MATVSGIRRPDELDAEDSGSQSRSVERSWSWRQVVAVVVGGALGGLVWASIGHHAVPATSAAPPLSSVAGGPTAPGALLVAADGSLYISDTGTDRIIQRLSTGSFHLLAGTGRSGFSGDGGIATHAELDDPGGMALGPGGTVYLADQGNNRVRAISPAGIITTVAGNGSAGWVSSGTLARSAPLGDPTAVAIGPGGLLYIAAEGSNQILRLNANGTLTDIVGARNAPDGLPSDGQLATAASPDSPTGLAFDATGDMFVAGGATKGLLVVTAGRVRVLSADGFYPRGSGGLVSSNGHVYAITSQQVDELSPSAPPRTLLNFAAVYEIDGVTGVLPNGIAVDRQGGIYLDTNVDDGYSDATAISYTTDRRATVLWRASKQN